MSSGVFRVRSRRALTMAAAIPRPIPPTLLSIGEELCQPVFFLGYGRQIALDGAFDVPHLGQQRFARLLQARIDRGHLRMPEPLPFAEQGLALTSRLFVPLTKALEQPTLQ